MPRPNLSETAATGDRLATLKVLRDTLAEAIEVTTDGKELAALALRLQRVLADIQELGGAGEKDEGDDLAAKRAAKLSAAAGS